MMSNSEASARCSNAENVVSTAHDLVGKKFRTDLQRWRIAPRRARSRFPVRAHFPARNRQQRPQSFRRDAAGSDAHFPRIPIQEETSQQRDVFFALAQRRKIDGNDVQPVEKIFAKFAFPHLLSQIHVGRGDDAHVHLNLVHAAQMHKLAVLQHAQNFALRVHAHGADFIQEKRSPVGDLKQAFLRSDRAGKRALSRARTEVDSSRSGGIEPVLTGTNGRSRRGEFRWMALAMSSLPVPLSPCSKHRRAAGRDLRHQIENLQHGLAFAHDVLEVVALLKCAFELDVLFFRPVARNRCTHIRQQLFIVPGLLDEICRARLHGFHRIFNRPVGGNHDHGKLGIAA